MIPGLRAFRWGAKDLYLHEDHRWALPLIWQAQQTAQLPCPVKVVLFDRHPDAATPERLDLLDQARAQGLNYQSLLGLCQSVLSAHDDDWIVAGMRLGLIESVVIFGVDDRMNELPKRPADGGLILGRYELPGKLLADKEDLVDHSRAERLRSLWEALDWEPYADGFRFRPDAPPILLDMDLDCFAYPYRERVLPWDEGIFASEFSSGASGLASRGWGGKQFFAGLAARAGLITVCREAGCCGGEENAEQIWALVAKHLFDDQLQPT